MVYSVSKYKSKAAHPTSGSLERVARTLYLSNDVDLQLAMTKITVFEQLGTIPQSSTSQQQSSSAMNQGNSSTDTGHNSKVAHNVSMRMRNEQYSGASSESLAETIALYTRIATDYELTISQRLQFFHNAFRGEALRYYEYSVVPVATIFAEAQELMSQHFSSRTRQNKAKEMLKQIKLDTVRRSQSVSTPRALELVREQIYILAPQCPREYNTDSHRSDSLAQSVRGESWATEVLRTHGAEPFSYQALYQRLESAIVFSDSAIDHSTSHDIHHSARTPSMSGVPRKDYYGVPRPRRPISVMQPKINQNRSCFNCGSPSHLLRNCPTRADIKSGILRHLQQRRNPSEVLYTLADELTEALSDTPTNVNEINVDEQLSQILDSTGDSNEETQDADDSQLSDIHLSPYVHDEFF
jgi:hypothetical protein